MLSHWYQRFTAHFIREQASAIFKSTVEQDACIVMAGHNKVTLLHRETICVCGPLSPIAAAAQNSKEWSKTTCRSRHLLSCCLPDPQHLVQECWRGTSAFHQFQPEHYRCAFHRRGCTKSTPVAHQGKNTWMPANHLERKTKLRIVTCHADNDQVRTR